jgi:death on curing protein
MRHLTISEILSLHARIVSTSGGASGLRDPGALESALHLPLATFSGQALYPTLADQAAILCFSLVSNHPFVDGNKRIGHAAMEVFLVLNGHELQATVDEQEQVILRIAAGEMSRAAFTAWLGTKLRPLDPTD